MPKIIERWPAGYTPPSWLPDWRDENEYSALERATHYNFAVDTKTVCTETVTTNKTEYAWEFLRRNPGYQSDFNAITDLAEKEGVAALYKKALGFNIFSISCKEIPPPSIRFHSELYAILEKWGLGYYLLDPSKNLHDTASLCAVGRLGNNCYPAEQVHQQGGGMVLPVDGGIIPDDNQSWWLFDISLPIGPQIKKAETFLKTKQKQFCGKHLSASGTEMRLYPLFLRLLDADVVGADTDEMLSILYPQSERFRYSEKSHTNPARKEMSSHRRSAYSLRDSGYKLLL